MFTAHNTKATGVAVAYQKATASFAPIFGYSSLNFDLLTFNTMFCLSQSDGNSSQLQTADKLLPEPFLWTENDVENSLSVVHMASWLLCSP